MALGDGNGASSTSAGPGVALSTVLGALEPASLMVCLLVTGGVSESGRSVELDATVRRAVEMVVACRDGCISTDAERNENQTILVVTRSENHCNCVATHNPEHRE